MVEWCQTSLLLCLFQLPRLLSAVVLSLWAEVWWDGPSCVHPACLDGFGTHESSKSQNQKTLLKFLWSIPLHWPQGQILLYRKSKIIFLLLLICMDITWGQGLNHHALTTPPLIILPNSRARSKGREKKKIFRNGLKKSKQQKPKSKTGVGREWLSITITG